MESAQTCVMIMLGFYNESHEQNICWLKGNEMHCFSVSYKTFTSSETNLLHFVGKLIVLLFNLCSSFVKL